MDFNPAWTAHRITGDASDASEVPHADQAQIERPGRFAHLMWQQRVTPPTDDEDALADAVEMLFSAGIQTLPQLVAGLNRLSLVAPGDVAWSEENFQTHLASLADPLGLPKALEYPKLAANNASGLAVRPLGAHQLLELGLRNQWVPVAPSWQVGSTALGLTRMGEPIVLWRGDDGRVHALEDRCPHRGARLSLGWNLGDRMACRYHGVQVDGTGTVRAVPALASSPLQGKRCVRAYPVQERAGAVFLWFGLAPDDPPATFMLPEQMSDGAQWSHMLCTAQWKVNHRHAIDHLMDPMRGAHLHAANHSMAQANPQAVMRARRTPAGLIVEDVSPQGASQAWVEYGDASQGGGCTWLRFPTAYRASAGPGGPLLTIGMLTPVDAQHCQVFFWRCRQVQGWQRSTWRFLYRNRLEGRHWAALERERMLLENLAPNAREHENLVEHDVGLAHVRRLMHKKAQAQAADLATAHAAAVAAAGAASVSLNTSLNPNSNPGGGATAAPVSLSGAPLSKF